MCTSIGRRSAKPDDRISSSWIPIIDTIVWPCGTGSYSNALTAARTARSATRSVIPQNSGSVAGTAFQSSGLCESSHTKYAT